MALREPIWRSPQQKKGFTIAVYNRTWATNERFLAESGLLATRIIAWRTMVKLASAFRALRPIIMMVKAGDVVDKQIACLCEVLETYDTIIEADNANYHDTVRRDAELLKSGLAFIGMGFSEREEPARHGPSILVSGFETSYKRAENVLTAISAKYKKQACCAWWARKGQATLLRPFTTVLITPTCK